MHANVRARWSRWPRWTWVAVALLVSLRLSLFDLNFGTGVYSGMLIETR